MRFRFVLIFVILCLLFFQLQAQEIPDSLVEKSRNYKAQNHRLLPGTNEPIFKYSFMPATGLHAASNYKTQHKALEKEEAKFLMTVKEAPLAQDTIGSSHVYTKSNFSVTTHSRYKPSKNELAVTTTVGR